MSIDEYKKNLGKAFEPGLSEQEEDEVLNWWLQYKSVAIRNNRYIPAQAEEAINHLQEKRKNRKVSSQQENQTNPAATTITVNGPFTGVLQTGNNNQADANLNPEGSSFKKFITENIGSIISGLIVALIVAWLGIENS